MEPFGRTVEAAGARDVEEGLQMLDVQRVWMPEETGRKRFYNHIFF